MGVSWLTSASKTLTSSSVRWSATSKVSESLSISPTMFFASLIFGKRSRISLSMLWSVGSHTREGFHSPWKGKHATLGRLSGRSTHIPCGRVEIIPLENRTTSPKDYLHRTWSELERTPRTGTPTNRSKTRCFSLKYHGSHNAQLQIITITHVIQSLGDISTAPSSIPQHLCVTLAEHSRTPFERKST